MHYVDYKEVGKRIAKRRKELGYKQSQVTEMAELSDKYLSNIERATSILSIDVLMKLCDTLQITPDYVLLGTATKQNTYGSETYITEKFDSLNERQKEVVLAFITWISEQEIC